MAQAYTPGLKLNTRVRHRCRRVLPLEGEVLVSVGALVSAEDVVARTLLPGPVTPVNVARSLSIPPAELPSCLRASVGEPVKMGSLLARSQGIFGWFPSECFAPVDGTLESASEVTGQVILRGAPLAVELRAYLTGTVIEVLPKQGVVIEGDATFIQGIFGIGGEAYGPVRLACERPADDLTPERIRDEARGAVLVGGARVTAAAIERAIACGVAAIVTGGIDDADLRQFLGYDIGVATTGSEQVGLTLILTEGFGDIAMAERTFRLLASRQGSRAAVSGATQIRAGVQRPEIVIPWPAGTAPNGKNGPGEPLKEETPTLGILRIGAPVRIIRDPHFGIIGTVQSLPPEPQRLGSGSKARVLEVQIAGGERILVPRANVELLEE